MKKMIYALILLLVVVSGLVFANRETGTAKIVFKSADGGQTWQDISQGLPQNLREKGIRGDSLFANEKGLFLMVGNKVYHNTPNATALFWTEQVLSGKPGSTDSSKSRTFAFNNWGVNVKKTDGTSVWSPIFDNSQEPRIRSTFETVGGAIFLGVNEGIFKTDDNGKTWKLVYAGAYVGHFAELNGVLVAIGMKRIIRSTDNGETWAPATSEDSVAFDVKPIKGGFVAITAASEPGTRRLSTSHDGGKTWQPIDARNKVFIDSIGRTWNDRPLLKAFMTPITPIGTNLFCALPDGIFKSSDGGKTWTLLLPSIDGKVFNLFASGNVIYAIPSKGGC